MMTIRQEQIDDTTAIRRVIQDAFGGSAEADLVDKLRAKGYKVERICSACTPARP